MASRETWLHVGLPDRGGPVFATLDGNSAIPPLPVFAERSHRRQEPLPSLVSCGEPAGLPDGSPLNAPVSVLEMFEVDLSMLSTT